MPTKILTVDDSRAVRIIVKKAFKSYDVDIVEAANGVEGLAAAAKETPDIVLLDVTMPVMDGIEMLTKLKADQKLKDIPVIMLTAEAGRENVLKIAKLGIRDYIVKPFEEDVLIEKVGRVVDIRPAGSDAGKQKTIHDECSILVVEDKPAIIKQIEAGLEHTPWAIVGAASQGEAIDAAQSTIPDVIIISLSLPEDSALGLFRMLRSNVKTKYIPVFGLAVKTAVQEQQDAQKAGITNIITKPIDFSDLEAKIAKAMNLDTSERYFMFDADSMIVHLPEKTSAAILHEVSSYLKGKVSEAVDNGCSRVIFDASAIQECGMEITKLAMEAMKVCKELTLHLALVGGPSFSSSCKNFEECKSAPIYDSIDEAKSSPVR